MTASLTAFLGSAYPWGDPPVVDSRENPNSKHQYGENLTMKSPYIAKTAGAPAYSISPEQSQQRA